MTAATPPDLNTKMTERARTVWSLGDFARAGAEQVIVGELLARAIDIHPGQRVLDVAAGSGNAALAAARRGARVIATDFVPQLLETAARRAETEGLELARRLKADAATRAILVVAVTAQAVNSDQDQGRGLSVDGYITKPLQPQQFRHALASFLTV